MKCLPIFLACLLNICNVLSSYKGIQMFKCVNTVLRDCSMMSPDKEHYLVTPDMKVLNKTIFNNMTDLLDIIGVPGAIREIKPGAFINLPKLKRIWLGGNLIKIIEHGVFNYLPIYYIYLAANSIQIIDTEAFAEMENLKEIYLDKNALTHFDPNWFKLEGKTSNLKILNFHHNKIKSINKKAFYDFPYLTELDFSFNKIEYISDDIFNTNPRLMVFDLSFNRLKTFSPTLLTGVRYVEKFIINFNYLRTLSPNMLEKTYIKSASVHPNQWICSCLKNFEERMYDKGVESFTSSEIFSSQKYLLKYQLPVNTQYVASNLSICYETWKLCDSNKYDEDFHADKPFNTILSSTYDRVNVKCVSDGDCAEGMLCRSNYCWYLITKAYFNVNDPFFFVWDTYVSFR